MKPSRYPVLCGVALTVLFHGGLLLLTVRSGLKYIYPPPEEKAITMEFPPEEEPKLIASVSGEAPRTPEPEPEKEVTLVKKAEAPVQVEKPVHNQAAESTVAEDGDVETPEPPRPKEINRRALFSAADNRKKDTLAPQVSSEASAALETGHSAGNTPDGATDGQPSARLYGRSVEGYLPHPAYTIQDKGVITVKIWVDRDGRVQQAQIDVRNTNISSATLREETLKAARAARFNAVSGGSELQQGTITYLFRLK